MAGESLKRRRKSGVDASVENKEAIGDSDGDEDLTVEILEKARVKIKVKDSDTAEKKKNDELAGKEEEKNPLNNSEAVKKIKKKKKKEKKNKTASEPAQKGGLVAGTGEKSGEFLSIASPPPKNGMEDNLEMNRLLRKQRYFSFSEDKCYRCGEEGHHSQDCTETAPSRPCFVCSQFGHDGFNCPQKNQCFICRKVGHVSRECPNRDSLGEEGSARKENICMRCGRSGHDAAKCNREYDQADLKLVECFICRERGHLSCADISLEAPEEVTCFNCGDAGHTGEGCARPRRAVKEGEQMIVQTCYICGEGGHFARGCSKANERSRMQGTRSRSTLQATEEKPSQICFECGKEGHIALTCPRKQTGQQQNRQAYASKSTSKAEPIKESYGSKFVSQKVGETYNPFVPSSTRTPVTNSQAQRRQYGSTRTDLRLSYPDIQMPQTLITGRQGGFLQQTTAMQESQAPFVFGANHQAHTLPRTIPRSIPYPLPRIIHPPVPRTIPHLSHQQVSSQPLTYNQRQLSVNHRQDQLQQLSSYAQWQQQFQLQNCRPYVTGRKK